MRIQHSSIENEIKEIVEISFELQEEEYFNFNEPAEEFEIECWERENQISVPTQYKEWLRFSNGSELEGTFAIFYGLKKMIVNKKDFDEPIVIIGSLVGDGEVLAFSIRTGEILKILNGVTKRYENFQKYLQFLIDIL